MKQQNKKAFTLVELVVVVAVLLILAAIAIPIVGGVINNAHIATDESNAKSIETAIKYAIAHNEIGDDISDTVGDALELSGMDTAQILDPEQPGYGFYYDNIGQSVVPLTAPRTANDILLDGTNTLNADGTVGPGSTVTPPTSSTTTPVNLTSFSISPTTASKTVGDADFALTPTIDPAGATNTGITWASSNDLVATVSGGTVHVVGVGTATITATLNGTTGGATNTATCAVTVTAAPVNLVSFSISPTNATKTVGDADFALTPTISPTGATNTGISWQSSNNGVATVTNGTVHVVAAGSATITATLNGTTGGASNTATCAVTVNPAVVLTTSVTIPSTLNLAYGASGSLTPTFGPAGYTDDTVTWSSSNTSVATVSGGTVQAVSNGTATITVRLASNPSVVFDTCTVTVAAPTLSFAFENSSGNPITSITLDYDDYGGWPSRYADVWIEVSDSGNGDFNNAGTTYTLYGQTYNVAITLSNSNASINNRDDDDDDYWLQMKGEVQGACTLTVTFTKGSEVITKTLSITIQN